jgi:Na+/H+ antiporter NhaA
VAEQTGQPTLVDELVVSLRHPSLAVVVLIGAAFAYLAHVSNGSRDLATPIFAISGTLVALIVPAASLSAQYVDPGLNYWTEQLVNGRGDMGRVMERGREHLAEMEGVVAPLWRGFVLVLLSFPLSAVAMFRPNATISGYSAEELLIGASVGLLVTAVFSFLPFTWAALQLDLARKTRAKLFTAEDQQAAGHDQDGAAQASQAANGIRSGEDPGPDSRIESISDAK